MASNIDITLKRYNGTDYDTILPTTHLGQIYTDNTLTTTLNSYLNSTFIPLLQKGQALGVATLDANQKLTASQLPAYIFGGMTYAGVVDLTSGQTIDDIMEAADPGDTVNKLSAVGEYLQVSETGVLSQGTTWTATVLAPGDEGDYDLSDGITLEAGDWVVVSAYDESANTVTLGIVNNTYQNATDAAKGIVTLSSASDTTGTTSKVITESVLGGFIPADNSDLNGTTNANKLAPAAHHHNGLYYTEGEIADFFNAADEANGALTGYNKGNWDTAHGWGNHADEGYLTEESLADLTDVSYTDLATHNILRYNGTNWVNDGTFKPMLYNDSFATGDGKATIAGTLCIEF